ncbi:MAG: hypothetical protein JWO38_2069 [Gemmataceae bacterium]|nr:hypothetical protein [Gemmataceae bacterium]
MTSTTAVREKEKETEELRQLVIQARASAEVESQADKCLDRLRQLYTADPAQFSTEDVRWVNVLRGFLAVRLAAHGPKVKGAPPVRTPKRKGDTLDHCWRCETPVDARFSDICPECDSKAYHWRVCPVCRACGCQRSGKILV